MDKVVYFLLESIEEEWVNIKSNQGHRERVLVTAITWPNGSTVFPSDLRPGLQVAVSLSSANTVQKVVLGAMPSNPGPFAKPVGPAKMPLLPLAPVQQGKSEPANYTNLRADFALATLNYSKRIYPIKFLKEAFAYFPEKQDAVRLIKQKCVGVRKCNPGDINGFWKALSVGYLELLTCDCTPITYLSLYVSLVRRQRGEGKLLSTLEDLERSRQMGRSTQQWLTATSLSCSGDSTQADSASSQCSPVLSTSVPSSDSQFWLEQVHFLRDFVLSFLIGATPSLSGQQTVTIPGLDSATIRLMADMDRENGEVSDINFHGAAQALNLRLVLMTTGLARVKERYEPEGSSGKVLFLYLFRDNLVFHLLYTQKQLANMGYNLETGDWQANRPDVKAMYARRKSKGKVVSSLESRVAAATAELQSTGQTLRLLQPLIRDITRMDLTAELRSHLQQDMAAPALTLLNETNWARKLTKCIESENTEQQHTLVTVWEAVHLQKVFLEAGFFHRPGCVESSEHSGSLVKLDCGHELCSDCAKRYLWGEEALCPLCGLSFQTTGVEYATNCLQKHCWKCDYYRQSSYFDESFCSNCHSDMCLFCYSQLFSFNSQLCDCGEPFRPYPHEQILQQTIITCKSCQEWKCILAFAAVECSDHRLCQDCWTGLDTCPVCQRVLDEAEIRLLASRSSSHKCLH